MNIVISSSFIYYIKSFINFIAEISCGNDIGKAIGQILETGEV